MTPMNEPTHGNLRASACPHCAVDRFLRSVRQASVLLAVAASSTACGLLGSSDQTSTPIDGAALQAPWTTPEGGDDP